MADDAETGPGRFRITNEENSYVAHRRYRPIKWNVVVRNRFPNENEYES
jgi:hypothetical protein